VFLLVACAATWLFGPVALTVLAVVAGGALIVTGARSSGWPRPALIVAGALVIAATALFLIDLATGWWQVSVR
jgi:hypothetical protein